MSIDIQNHFSLQNRIVELEAQIVELEKKLVLQIKLKSKHKRNAEKLREKYTVKPVSRCDKARVLIAQRERGEIKITLVEIAKKYFLSYTTVKALARDYRKQKNASL